MRVKFLRKIPHEVIRDLSDLIATQKSEWSKSNLYIYTVLPMKHLTVNAQKWLKKNHNEYCP